MTVDDRGSVLMLVPAAILVLVALGSIALDSSLSLFAARDLTARTAAVANDAAAGGVSDPAFYAAGGEIRIDPVRAQRYADEAFSPDHRPAGYEKWHAEVTTDGRRVEVDATAEVRLIFARALPSVRHTVHVTARSVATARGG